MLLLRGPCYLAGLKLKARWRVPWLETRLHHGLPWSCFHLRHLQSRWMIPSPCLSNSYSLNSFSSRESRFVLCSWDCFQVGLENLSRSPQKLCFILGCDFQGTVFHMGFSCYSLSFSTDLNVLSGVGLESGTWLLLREIMVLMWYRKSRTKPIPPCSYRCYRPCYCFLLQLCSPFSSGTFLKLLALQGVISVEVRKLFACIFTFLKVSSYSPLP